MPGEARAEGTPPVLPAPASAAFRTDLEHTASSRGCGRTRVRMTIRGHGEEEAYPDASTWVRSGHDLTSLQNCRGRVMRPTLHDGASGTGYLLGPTARVRCRTARIPSEALPGPSSPLPAPEGPPPEGLRGRAANPIMSASRSAVGAPCRIDAKARGSGWRALGGPLRQAHQRRPTAVDIHGPNIPVPSPRKDRDPHRQRLHQRNRGPTTVFVEGRIHHIGIFRTPCRPQGFGRR